ncbi:Uncharacterized protein QTN25_005049 [Entamoeba marina]
MNITKIIEFFKNHIFAIIIVSYFLIVAGVIYDVINEPPGIGQTVDKYGNVKPESIMKGRSNGQYVVEGLCASMFFVMTAGGFIMIEKSTHMTEADRKKPIFAIGGSIIFTIALAMIYVFVRAKFY